MMPARRSTAASARAVGMMGDRALVIFAAPKEINKMIEALY
jgi:hypothetical protein